MRITNWGKYPVIEAESRTFTTPGQLRELIGGTNEAIARGMGRCYGDSSLNSFIIDARKYNRILAFDPETGIVQCEAGVSLDELLKVFVPRGWFLPVTPGTKFVTVGGAIASDVHGKNHHIAGSISNHIISLDIMLDDGSIWTCSKQERPDLFWATCGGMGLTGVILSAAFGLQRIETAYIKQETVKARNIHEIMDVFEQSQAWSYSVAWIDCIAKGEELGRSVMTRGDHATIAELQYDKQRAAPLAPHSDPKLNVPLDFPGFALNPFTVKAFNAFYYGRAGKGTRKSVVHYNPFFYPLDIAHNWNRIYGKRGFTQYQFVLPLEASREGMPAILARIAENGHGSFLAVLKLFGEQEGLLSFPIEGYTLALDFPVSKKLLAFLDLLDEMVLYYGGRLYLTKDVRMSGDTLRKGYPALSEFEAIRKRYNEQTKFASLQSKRLGL